MSEQSLKDKTAKATFWSAADGILGQGITFIVGLVLARLLGPEEYGLIGIITIFTTVLMNVVNSGFSSALVRKIDTTDKDYNTMFITNMAFSIFLYVLLYVSSPFIAKFFERPILIKLIRVTGLILIIQALSITQVTILTKRIDFKTKMYASLIGSIISGIVGIGMALGGCGVWALVGQLLSRQLFNTISLWILNRWLPNFQFSMESFRYMWGFGWKLLVSWLLNDIWAQLYQVVVGKFYSPATLGQYTRSRQIAAIFSDNLTGVVQKVTYPVLSQIQNNQERMVAAYRRIIKVTMFVTCLCMLSIGAVAEPLVYCLIGPQWHEAATYLPLICISMSLYPMHSINLNMLQVMGRSDMFLYLEIIKKVIAIIPICIGIFIDIYWMLLASLFTGVLNFFLNSYYTGKKLGYSSWMQLKDVSADYGVALLVALSVYFFKYLPISNWIILPIQIIIGAVVALIICNTTKMQEYLDLIDMVKSLIKKIKK